MTLFCHFSQFVSVLSPYNLNICEVKNNFKMSFCVFDIFCIFFQCYE